MIETVTRSLLRSGDSRGVVLSPGWLRKYTPKQLYVVYLDGLVLVFPTEQAAQLENAFGEAIARIVQRSITKDQQSTKESGTRVPDGER